MAELTASEALYGFCGWLTTREEVTKMGHNEDCVPVADRIKEFCESNRLSDPRGDFGGRIVHPGHQCVESNA